MGNTGTKIYRPVRQIQDIRKVLGVKGANTGYMWARESDGVALGRLETDGVSLRFRSYSQLISGGVQTVVTNTNISDYAIASSGGEIYGDLYSYANITNEIRELKMEIVKLKERLAAYEQQ